MYKKIFNFMVLVITVLTVNLVTGAITDYIIHAGVSLNPLKFTLIAMVALVFILVPSYRYIGSKIELLAARVLVSGSASLGKTLGLLFSFTLVFAILFLIYLNKWFHINLFDYLSS